MCASFLCYICHIKYISTKTNPGKMVPEKWSPKNGPRKMVAWKKIPGKMVPWKKDPRKMLLRNKNLRIPRKVVPGEMVPRKMVPRKMVSGKMVFYKFHSTHKNVTVIFVSKYRRLLFIENGFVVEFWVFIHYVTLTWKYSNFARSNFTVFM